MMQVFGKIMVGLGGAAANFIAWWVTFVYGAINVLWLVGAANSISRFNNSRGTMFDTMAFLSATKNPLQNANIPHNLSSILLYCALGFTLLILLKTITAPSIRHALFINMNSIAGGLAGVVLTIGVLNWLGDGSFSSIGKVVYVCVPLVVVLKGASMWIASSLQTPDQNDVAGLKGVLE